jgi:hypothetical protein
MQFVLGTRNRFVSCYDKSKKKHLSFLQITYTMEKNTTRLLTAVQICFRTKTMASMKTVAAKQKKNVKLILHIILELANKFGLAIDKNTLKEMTFSKAIKILQSVLKKIQHTAGHLSQLKHVNIDKVT